jgi:hypothetical protein
VPGASEDGGEAATVAEVELGVPAQPATNPIKAAVTAPRQKGEKYII